MTTKEHEENFCGEGNVIDLDLDVVIQIYMQKNHQAVHLIFVYFI